MSTTNGAVRYLRAVAGGARRGPGPLTRALAEILTREAADQGLSGKKLAALTNVSQPQMAGYLRGELVLNIEELQLICSNLGLDLIDTMTAATSS